MVLTNHLASGLHMAREGHMPLETVFHQMSEDSSTHHYVTMDKLIKLGYSPADAMAITIFNSLKTDPDNELVKTFIDMVTPDPIEIEDRYVDALHKDKEDD